MFSRYPISSTTELVPRRAENLLRQRINSRADRSLNKSKYQLRPSRRVGPAKSTPVLLNATVSRTRKPGRSAALGAS